jgi:hypothetical protein
MKYKYIFPYSDIGSWKNAFDTCLTDLKGKFRISLMRNSIRTKVLQEYDTELFYDFFEQLDIQVVPEDNIVVEFQTDPLQLFIKLIPSVDWSNYGESLILTKDDITFTRQISALVSERMLGTKTEKHLKHPFNFGQLLDYSRFPAVLRALDYCWLITKLYWYPQAQSVYFVVRHSGKDSAFILSRKGVEDIGPLFLNFDFEKGFYLFDSEKKRKYLPAQTPFMQDFNVWLKSGRSGDVLRSHFN